MDKIERVHERLLAMNVGATAIVYERVVTRWEKDVFELDTWGQDAGQGSESTAEAISGTHKGSAHFFPGPAHA